MDEKIKIGDYVRISEKNSLCKWYHKKVMKVVGYLNDECKSDIVKVNFNFFEQHNTINTFNIEKVNIKELRKYKLKRINQ